MVNKKTTKKVNDKVPLMVKCLDVWSDNDIWALVWAGGGGLFFNFLFKLPILAYTNPGCISLS